MLCWIARVLRQWNIARSFLWQYSGGRVQLRSNEEPDLKARHGALLMRSDFRYVVYASVITNNE